MTEIDLLKATPGSDLALDHGCLCSVLDNAHGKGINLDGEQFWINDTCPLHGGGLFQEEEDEP